MLDMYSTGCQVALISRDHRNARKFLGASCEFLIFLLALYSKRVRLIQPLFHSMPAGGNLQRLKSAEMKNQVLFQYSEKEIKRDQLQRKTLNSGILTETWQNEHSLWYPWALHQDGENFECCELVKTEPGLQMLLNTTPDFALVPAGALGHWSHGDCERRTQTILLLSSVSSPQRCRGLAVVRSLFQEGNHHPGNPFSHVVLRCQPGTELLPCWSIGPHGMLELFVFYHSAVMAVSRLAQILSCWDSFILLVFTWEMITFLLNFGD